jgi:hypothetical protein
MSSCVQKQETIGDAGTTFVKLYPDTYTMKPFDAASAPQSGLLFEVRKDVNSLKNVNTQTTAVLKFDTDGKILDKYNEVNETEFIALPVELGQTDPAPVGGVITLTFAPGDIAKAININIPNASSFDFT